MTEKSLAKALLAVQGRDSRKGTIHVKADQAYKVALLYYSHCCHKEPRPALNLS